VPELLQNFHVSKISSALLLADRVQLKLETTAVSASLGVNERLFLCSASQVEQLVRDANC